MGARVLVVEDDATVAEVVMTYLGNAGHDVEYAPDGATALRLAARRRPDLVILDLMLPGVDGREVYRRLRRADLAADGTPEPIPVIMLTALGSEDDRVRGLELGADDYVTKPFSPRELVLRVRSVLRRHGGDRDPELPKRLTDADLDLDTAARQAMRNGVELALTVREFDLLAYLMSHPRRAFTREHLLEKVWGWSFGDQSTVTVHVRRLREKVEDDPARPRRLVTVWGVGYRWEPAA
ncbi:MAG TPA: response regulator transcription factor [Actinopolymorphaceae bacterium]